MSIAGILSSNLFNFNSQNVPDRMQKFRQEFQQLGQDLQTGNLNGAQADFAATAGRPTILLRNAEQQPHGPGLSATQRRSSIGQPHGGAAGLREHPIRISRIKPRSVPTTTIVIPAEARTAATRCRRSWRSSDRTCSRAT